MFKVEKEIQDGQEYFVMIHTNEDNEDLGPVFAAPSFKEFEDDVIETQAQGNAMYNALARFKEANGIT